MTRFVLVLAALFVWTIAGCGGADNNATATDSTEAETDSAGAEEDVKDAGLEGMSAEEYNRGGPSSDN
jgi:uncharacterized lipoprotein